MINQKKLCLLTPKQSHPAGGRGNPAWLGEGKNQPTCPSSFPGPLAQRNALFSGRNLDKVMRERKGCLCFCPETITSFHLHENIVIKDPSFISKMILQNWSQLDVFLIGLLFPIERIVLHWRKIDPFHPLCPLVSCVVDLVHSFILQNVIPALHWTWGLTRNPSS